MDWYNILKAAILGVVEGITEWLPISSTGHLILVDEFIHLNETEDFMKMFNVVIQLGAILAVVILFFHKLNPFSPTKDKTEKNQTWSLWFKVVVACIPSAVIGIPLDDFFEEKFHNFIMVALMLIIYGVLFIVVEKYNKNRIPKVENFIQFTYKEAILIGLFQVLSLMPGTSRSGATILGGILIGCSRFVATEFSFFLGIPTMFGASALKIAKFILTGNSFTWSQIVTLQVGMIVAFLVSIWAIKFLMNYLKRHDFTAFGWYRIILGTIVILYWVIAR